MCVQIPPSPPHRRKCHIACGDFLLENYRALILLRLFSKLQPLSWVAIWFDPLLSEYIYSDYTIDNPPNY